MAQLSFFNKNDFDALNGFGIGGSLFWSPQRLFASSSLVASICRHEKILISEPP